MNHSRRAICFGLPALAVSTTLADERSSLPSRMYRFDELPIRTQGENSFRSILKGTTHDGCQIEAHESALAPGGMPHPPHHHAHEEMFLIREGILEINIAGRTSRLGPGSAAFVASNEEHSIRNVGLAIAQYFVLALGSDK